MSTRRPPELKAWMVGLVLGLLVAGWILFEYRDDSDYIQVVAWALLLGAITAAPFLLYALFAWADRRDRSE